MPDLHPYKEMYFAVIRKLHIYIINNQEESIFKEVSILNMYFFSIT